MSRTTFYEELGRRIREARERMGWSQLRLGVALGLSTGVAVHYWETGKHRPDLFTVLEIERTLGGKIHGC